MPVGPIELLVLLFICGVPLVLGIVFVVVLLTRTRSGSSTPAKQESALEILEQRYARGEIDSEEFDERRNRILRDTR